MLHLFNSCYVYPDALFDPTSDYLVVGSNHYQYQAVEQSFYYGNSFPRNPLARFNCYELFNQNEWRKVVLNNKDRCIIYTDNDNFIKFFTAKLKCQMTNLTTEFFLTCAKLFAVKLKARAKLISVGAGQEKINALADVFLALESIPNVQALTVPRQWVLFNAGVEWKFAVRKYDGLKHAIDRNIYSYFEEAKARYLSRKDPAGAWATNPDNQQYSTVASIKNLYMEMRKETLIFTDSLILEYFDSQQIFENPKFLLLLTSNKNKGDKIDIWLMRWFMKMSPEQINQLGIIA